MPEISERQQLSRIILQIVELRDQSSYKKTYDFAIKTLEYKLKRMPFKSRSVDNITTT